MSVLFLQEFSSRLKSLLFNFRWRDCSIINHSLLYLMNVQVQLALMSKDLCIPIAERLVGLNTLAKSR